MFERVLVPTDLSEHSKNLLDCIVQLPGVKEIVLLNVVVEESTNELKDAEVKLNGLTKYLDKTGFVIKTKAEVRPEDEGISSIVMAWSKGALQNCPPGSVSRDVLCCDDTHLIGIRLSEAALRCRVCSKGLDIACHVTAGDAAKEINETADGEDASLIAMSSLGRSSSGGAQTGRTAYDVANTAIRPVLVIRADKV
jgi:nucleotide-binding universal stress UspA family protein